MKKAHIVSLFSALISIISFFAFYVSNSAKGFIWDALSSLNQNQLTQERFNQLLNRDNIISLYIIGDFRFLFIIIAGFFGIIFIVSLVKGFKKGE